MTSINAQVKIQCPIGLFEQQEAKNEVLTKAELCLKTASLIVKMGGADATLNACR